MEHLAISMVIFNSYVTNYERVLPSINIPVLSHYYPYTTILNHRIFYFYVTNYQRVITCETPHSMAPDSPRTSSNPSGNLPKKNDHPTSQDRRVFSQQISCMWLVGLHVTFPSEKYDSQLKTIFPIELKQNVPNHQQIS